MPTFAATRPWSRSGSGTPGRRLPLDSDRPAGGCQPQSRRACCHSRDVSRGGGDERRDRRCVGFQISSTSDQRPSQFDPTIVAHDRDAAVHPPTRPSTQLSRRPPQRCWDISVPDRKSEIDAMASKAGLSRLYARNRVPVRCERGNGSRRRDCRASDCPGRNGMAPIWFSRDRFLQRRAAGAAKPHRFR